MKRVVIFLAMTVLFVTCFSTAPDALAADKYRIAWSHYTGWEPWAYADESGLLKKWADRYGIEIELVLVNDYIESINLYTTGEFNGCVMTNMDALTLPAIGGIDSTALIIGDFSDGNDGIVLKGGEKNVSDLKGKKIRLVQLSVSHYLLARALAMNGMTERETELINSSDADIVALFAADTDPKAAVVTWNPLLMEARNVKGANLLFDSSEIPGEIIDMMVVRTDAPENLKRALVGAWYETMEIMSGRGNTTNAAIKFMAEKAGGTVAEFEAQLKTTAMFYKAAEAVAFVKSEQLKETMEYVRTFSFQQGLFGGAPSKESVGISFPDGTIMGDPQNVKLRFDATVMEMAAEGKL